MFRSYPNHFYLKHALKLKDKNTHDKKIKLDLFVAIKTNMKHIKSTQKQQNKHFINPSTLKIRKNNENHR
ncbi:hypothetical protein XM47_15225 [Catenovulum maritimum]|uniref:Uncharacterized protein n=1 Tax=Catenovulum maritimum TaxID=1513271 RepID=A0A0J8GSF7_9ALTE|nr:hypothetical protein XM47_15225 [Catenovulum maritimum]